MTKRKDGLLRPEELGPLAAMTEEEARSFVRGVLRGLLRELLPPLLRDLIRINGGKTPGVSVRRDLP